MDSSSATVTFCYADGTVNPRDYTLENLNKTHENTVAANSKDYAADKKEASAEYTKSYVTLYRQAVEAQIALQRQLLNDGIAAGTALNESLWSACGTANASLFNSAQYNDPVPAVLSYLRSQSQAEVAAMSASAELYGTFQVNWRSEVINSEQGTSNADALHLAAFESDLAWAQKVASARDAYYAELGESTSSFNESFLDALESYNSSMLGAEFARAQGLFNASKDYSLGSYSIESEYARTRFETSAAHSLSMLDAAVAEMVGLADMEAYYARKSADEYAGIGIDENGITRRWDIDTKNSTAMYEKRSLITETKKAADALLNALNQSNTTADDAEYQGSLLTLQTVYDAAIALAEDTYNSTLTTADADYNTAVDSAMETFDDDYCRLTGLFYDATLAIDSGGTIEADYFANGASSMNVQVCFAAGYEVELADGTTKKIEDFEGGEVVWARPHNAPNGSLQKCKVVRGFKNGIKETMLVRFGNGLELRGTKEHPFFVQGKGWLPLGELNVGDVCYDKEQEPVVVKELIRDGQAVEVYNIEVEGAHTYYIGKNGQSVLVHNECLYTGEPLCFHVRCLARNFPSPYLPVGALFDPFWDTSTIYSNAKNAGHGRVMSFYVSGGTTLASMTGVTSYTTSIDPTDPVTGRRLTSNEQAREIISGSAALALTGVGIRSGIPNIAAAPKTVPLVTPKPVNTPISKLVKTTISDDTLIHFSPDTHNTITLNRGKSFWFRYGDIKTLTPNQIQQLIGPGTGSGGLNGTKVIHIKVEPNIQFEQIPPNSGGFYEYIHREPVGVLPIELH